MLRCRLSWALAKAIKLSEEQNNFIYFLLLLTFPVGVDFQFPSASDLQFPVGVDFQLRVAPTSLPLGGIKGGFLENESLPDEWNVTQSH